MQRLLQQIISFADNAHGEQQRKYTPERYIAHPIRVMETCRLYSEDSCLLAAAVLHDVLEDTPVTHNQLHQFLLTLMTAPQATRTMQLVTDLTDVYTKKDFPALNRRDRKNKELQRLEKTTADSQTIKYADIIDNIDGVVVQDPDFAKRFLQEYRAVLKKLNKGNAELYQKAVKSVKDAIDLLGKTAKR